MGTFVISLRFKMLCHHVFVSHSGSICLKFTYVTSPQKQVTNVCLILKDSDTESENLSSLIRFSVSDGQKTDSSNVIYRQIINYISTLILPLKILS